MAKIIKLTRQVVASAALICAGMSADAQSAASIERSGDAAFARGDYYSASKFYSAILYDSPLVVTQTILYPFQSRKKTKPDKVKPSRRNEVTYKLAEAWRLCNRPAEALQQYEKYVASGDRQYPLAQLWYGYSLIANNRPEKASAAFNTYLKANRGKDPYAEKAREGIATANFIIASRATKSSAELARLNATGAADGSDFALEKINDSLFFFTTSRHELDKRGEKVYPMRVYTGNLNKQIPARLNGIPDELNVATPSLSADGLTMYFTGWKTNEKTGTSAPYHIYYMPRNAIDSPWRLPVELPDGVNKKGYQSKQPFISRDGRYLFFASDQPGGAGKFDIWMVAMNGRMPAGTPVNLSNVNTAADDVTPFYDADSSQLYFSSDGRIGMGGLDIYKADGNPSENRWVNIANLGAPLNSVRDDQYYRRDRNSQTAYLSSDRASSCCLEIFRVSAAKYVDTAKPELTAMTAVLPKAVIPPVVSAPVSADNEAAVNKRMLDSINAVTLERNYVNYEYASSHIRKADQPQLETIVRRLKENPALNIVVASFTDCLGTIEGNMRIAKKRSESVKAYLVAKGVDASRINTDFYSRRYFVQPCNIRSSRKEEQLANRRSDLILTQETKPKWRPLGNELDLDRAEINPMYSVANANFDTRPIIAANKSDNTPVVKAAVVREENESVGNAGTEKPGSVKNTLTASGNTERKTNSSSGKRNTAAAKEETKSKSRYASDKQITPRKQPVKQDNEPAAYRNSTATMQTTASSSAKPNAVIAAIDINTALTFAPRVNDPVIDEMTKRIPRQPLMVYSSSDSVRVDLYDNGVFDSDSVSVIFNRELVAYKRVLQTNKPISFYIKLNGEPAKNEMIFFAENLGLTPPNSALMVITDADNRRTEVNVASDLEHNTVIYFIKLKKEKP